MFLTAVGWWLPRFEKLEWATISPAAAGWRRLSFTSIEYVAVVMRAHEGEGGI
jgi:hypothetical protein